MIVRFFFYATDLFLGCITKEEQGRKGKRLRSSRLPLLCICQRAVSDPGITIPQKEEIRAWFVTLGWVKLVWTETRLPQQRRLFERGRHHLNKWRCWKAADARTRSQRHEGRRLRGRSRGRISPQLPGQGRGETAKNGSRCTRDAPPAGCRLPGCAHHGWVGQETARRQRPPGNCSALNSALVGSPFETARLCLFAYARSVSTFTRVKVYFN